MNYLESKFIKKMSEVIDMYDIFENPKNVKGLRCKIKDIRYEYLGYVSRVYKKKLIFIVTDSTNPLLIEGSMNFDIITFEKMINNEMKDIRCWCYVEK